MIVNDEYRSYDTVGHFYYLTIAGAVKETGYDLDELWENGSNRLKRHGRTLHNWLANNPYNQTNQQRYRPIDLLEHRIFMNSFDEAEMIYRMLVEMVEWAYHTDGDLNIYENGATINDYVPQTVKDMAVSFGIKHSGDVVGHVDEDDFRVDY